MRLNKRESGGKEQTQKKDVGQSPEDNHNYQVEKKEQAENEKGKEKTRM